jgi:hypothetical protein
VKRKLKQPKLKVGCWVVYAVEHPRYLTYECGRVLKIHPAQRPNIMYPNIMYGRVKIENLANRDDIDWEIPFSIIENETEAVRIQMALMRLNGAYNAVTTALTQMFCAQRDTLVQDLPRFERFPQPFDKPQQTC